MRVLKWSLACIIMAVFCLGVGVSFSAGDQNAPVTGDLQKTKTKILLVNVNSSEQVSANIMKAAKKRARPDTELVIITNPAGTKVIDCQFGEYMAARSDLLAMLQKVKEYKPDAVIVAGFGNFGLNAMKEALDIPVVGFSEATMAVATLLGHRFSIITIRDSFVPNVQDLVRVFGYEAKCASVSSVYVDVKKYGGDRSAIVEELKKEFLRVIKENKAEVIVLGGAAYSGLDEDLAKAAGVPVLDPAVISVKVAEMLVGAGLSQSKIGKYAFPPQGLEAYN